MNNDIISIIMPVYNCDKYLSETIKSVKNQDYSNWELIIVDDNSTDQSLKIIKEETQDIKQKVKIISLKKNIGVALARNLALGKANGNYIAYLDADDVWEKEKLSKQLQFMKQNKIAFSYTAYSRIKEDGKFSRVVKAPKKTTYKDLLKSTIMLTSTIMVDISKIKKEKLKMPNLRGSEDTQTWFNILKSDVVAYGLNENLAKYRIRKNSMSSNRFKSTLGIWVVYRKYEKLGIIKSLYYIFMHIINAIKKRIAL